MFCYAYTCNTVVPCPLAFDMTDWFDEWNGYQGHGSFPIQQQNGQRTGMAVTV